MRRRTHALILAIAATTALAAGALPACVAGLCCPVADAPSIHAQMPCCESETSIAPRDAVRLLPASSSAGFATPTSQTWAAVAVVERSGATDFPSRVAATLATDTAAHHEHSPPLFLLNAQFLI